MSSSAQDDSQPQASKEYQILQDNKDFVSQVAAVKLVEFSTELSRMMVISKKVNKVFATLDDTVDPKLRLRYLLQHVCEGVKRDVTIFQHFIEVLSGYGGGMRKLATRLTAESYESESGACSEREVVGTDIFLSKVHVAELMQTLFGVSDKWEELGTALGLPQHAIRVCSRCSSNATSMTSLLNEWISRGQPENITLDKLRCALQCELVGRHSVAQTLEKRFRESHKPSVTVPVARTPGLDSTLRIEYLSSDAEVADGKSIVLEAQASESDGVCYQWMKDGQALSDNLAYFSTRTSMLAISPASQGTDGEYTCHIMKGSEYFISEAVLLTVSFPPEKEHLLRLYSKNTEVPRDSWPPKVTNTFVNLALITKNKEGDDYQSAVRGDIDDIIETKEKIEYAAVFGEYESGALVLVEGRPGSGKTTLMHKVTQDWAISEQVLKNAKLVFLIPLRSLANSNTEKLSDILELIYEEKKICEKMANDIEDSKGEGVCFIFDGLDEFHPQDGTNSVIHQLLYEEKYLPAAMVIVSSRPVATDRLRRASHVTRRVEVLGFSQQQFFEYIDNFPFASDNSPSQLKAYLHSYPNLLHMCYLPVHVGMICFLYDHEKGNIPLTEREIYEHFTTFIVMRNLRCSNEKAELGSLKDLRGKEKEYFSNICQLAFDMTLHSTQTVHQRDTKVPLSLGTGPNDAASLGLVTIDRTAGLHRLHHTYAFLHLTLQEYLAARHLAQLKKKEQKKMMQLYAGEMHMRMMWKFYCGIVKSEDMVAQLQHIMWPKDKKSPKDDILYELHCAFVSQQRVLCDSFVERRGGVLEFSGCILTSADMTALAYVISTSSHPVTQLVMQGCHLHADDVRTLVREVSHKKLKCIRTLRLSGNNFGDDGAAALAQGLKSCNNLQILELYDNNIGDDIAAALAKGLKSFFTHFEQDADRKYDAYLLIIKTNVTVDLPFLKFIFLGQPRLGKTTARRRLTGVIDDLLSAGEAEESHPSTGAVETGPSVMIRCLSSTTAVVTELEWSTMNTLTEESRMPVDNLLELITTKLTSADTKERRSTPSSHPEMRGGEESEPTVATVQSHPQITPRPAPSSESPLSTTESVPSSAAPPSSGQHQAKVDAMFREALRAEHLKAIQGMLKAYLRMEDTGGQPELMDMLPALTTRAGLYLLFVDLRYDLKKTYKISHCSRSGKSTTAPPSIYTVEEMLLSAL